MRHDPQRPTDPTSLPEPIRAAMQSLQQPAAAVPPEVDRRIAAAANRHLAAVRRQRRLRRWAACAAVAASLLLPLALQPDRHTPTTTLVRGSTILDAFALARRLEAGRFAGHRWDYNGDGFVDHNDVDALARAAVRLEDDA